jgi:membrane protease YdiL (CAAX protease family)
MPVKMWVKQSPLIAYFVLVFGFVWLIFYIFNGRVSPMIILLIGSWLPNIVGLFVTGLVSGWSEIKDLGKRVILWRIGFKWYVIALIVPVFSAVLAIRLNNWINGSSPEFSRVSQLFPILIIALFTGALGEELGWRGAALPLLQERWNALISSLIRGLYHLPAILVAGLPQHSSPFLPFMLAGLALTVFITWTFNHTLGSLIPVFLYPFAFNFIANFTGIFGVPSIVRMWAGIVSIGAIAVIIVDWFQFTSVPKKFAESEAVA